MAKSGFLRWCRQPKTISHHSKTLILPPIHFRNAKKSILVSLSVALIGLAFLLVALFPVTRAEEVIATSFTLASGAKYGPYDAETVYHTRVLTFKSVLQGSVVVEGGGVYLTVRGYNAPLELRSFYVEEEKGFAIESADDQYTFTFDNTQGSASSLVKFTLREIWTATYSPTTLVLGLIGLFLLIPSGLITLTIAHIRAKTTQRKTTTDSTRQNRI